MVKIISGGGSSYANALSNMKNKLDVDVCKDKCKYVISNILDVQALGESVDKSLLKDEYAKYMFNGDNGGTIMFSTDLNATVFSDNAVKNWIVQKFRTFKNRFTVKSFLNRLRLKEGIKAWTIGQYLIGVYTDNAGNTFNEKSYALNIIGIDRKTLFKIAKEICAYLGQESVLVHDATTHQVYLVDLS